MADQTPVDPTIEIPLDRRPAIPSELDALHWAITRRVRPLAKAALGSGEFVFCDSQRLVFSLPTLALQKRGVDALDEMQSALAVALPGHSPQIEVVVGHEFRESDTHLGVRVQIFDQAASMVETSIFATLHELNNENSQLRRELHERGIRIQELEDQVAAMAGMLREAHRSRNPKLLRWIATSKSALLIALLTGVAGGVAQEMAAASVSPATVVTHLVQHECNEIVGMLDRIEPPAPITTAPPTAVRTIATLPAENPF